MESAKSSKLIARNCVLCDINLDVAAGQVIALVGPSGAGKTTLCNLVARFFDPTSGSIALDGRDIRDITIDSYRRLFGIVEQDTFLFDGTIAENIAYGRRNATHAEIEQAASSANAEEFIKNLSAGYETLIGERGVKLSAGQRQRITIARALLADPRILIFDEATSNLDTESERLIQASLQTLMQGRTSFVIAHRLSTIAHADRILVMEKGQIVEQGRHEELMQANSRYREMVLLQTSPPAPPRRGCRAFYEDARSLSAASPSACGCRVDIRRLRPGRGHYIDLLPLLSRNATYSPRRVGRPSASTATNGVTLSQGCGMPGQGGYCNLMEQTAEIASGVGDTAFLGHDDD